MALGMFPPVQYIFVTHDDGGKIDLAHWYVDYGTVVVACVVCRAAMMMRSCCVQEGSDCWVSCCDDSCCHHLQHNRAYVDNAVYWCMLLSVISLRLIMCQLVTLDVVVLGHRASCVAHAWFAPSTCSGMGYHPLL